MYQASLPIVGWVDSPAFDRHENPGAHPERPARLRSIRNGIAAAGLDDRLQKAEPTPVDRALLESIHDPELVATIERLCAAGGGAIDEDTHAGPFTFEVACLAAGAVVDAVNRVLDGAWTRAFCSVRPPGHHATRDRSMGFCIFNNVAIGAAAALARTSVRRVAVIDWDAHHGNGTQDIFASNERVFYASWHQFPCYPGTGASWETGEGKARGTILNCPQAAGAGDNAFLTTWHDAIAPALARFAPDLLLISAGFDADARDPLTDLGVTTAGYAELSRQVVAWAEEHCEGRIISVLEGGYHLDALAEDVNAHLHALLAG